MTSAKHLKELIEKNRPRPYDFTDPQEVRRLYRECLGYLHTCHHKHGTDWEGRKFAMDALEVLAKANQIPSGVYYHDSNFYDAESRIGKGIDFFQRWVHRCGEFPCTPEAARAHGGPAKSAANLQGKLTGSDGEAPQETK